MILPFVRDLFLNVLLYVPVGTFAYLKLASLFGRILGVHRLRMDLDQLRRFRLGGLSLWSLGQSGGLRLDVVSGN